METKYCASPGLVKLFGARGARTALSARFWRRSADIPVRSTFERQDGERRFQKLWAFGGCCGQECPRSLGAPGFTRTRLSALRWFDLAAMGWLLLGFET